MPDLSLREAATAALSERAPVAYDSEPWSFTSLARRQAVLKTGPQAANYLEELAGFDPEIAAPDEYGFLPVTLTL